MPSALMLSARKRGRLSRHAGARKRGRNAKCPKERQARQECHRHPCLGAPVMIIMVVVAVAAVVVVVVVLVIVVVIIVVVLIVA